MSDRTNESLPDVETLSCECVDVKPVEIDWFKRYGDNCDGWCVIAPLTCSECKHSTTDESAYAGGECPDCGAELEDWIDRDEGPMMACYYPLPRKWAVNPAVDNYAAGAYDADDAQKLHCLPLCLVEFDDGSYALALTSGAMDLSWETCEAFMRLGFLPPVHFEPPAMADRPRGEVGQWIVAGYVRSCEVLAGWCERRAERVAGMVRPRGAVA